MTRQALYRCAQLAAGKCGRGCGRPRWDSRTMCEACTRKLRADRRLRYLDASEFERDLKEAHVALPADLARAIPTRLVL